jgi:hypothetical protein
MCRLVDFIDHAITLFPYPVRRNYNAATRSAVSLVQTIGEDEIRSQIRYHETGAEHGTCECAQSIHFTATFDEPLPCCHLLADGVPRPRMTKNLELQGQKDSDQLSIKLEKAVREREPPPPERKTTLQAIAARNIKRGSKTGKKLEVVRAWVDHAWEAQVSR